MPTDNEQDGKALLDALDAVPPEDMSDVIKGGVENAPSNDPLTPEEERVLSPIRLAKRDDMGLVTGPTKHLTDDQVRWLCVRMNSKSDLQATRRSNPDPDNPKDWELEVQTWWAEPDWPDLVDYCLHNKRDAFRVLGAHLLPTSLKAIQDILEHGTEKGKLTATKLLAQSQGLLIDRTHTENKDLILELVADLRTPTVVTLNEGVQHAIDAPAEPIAAPGQEF